MGEPPWPGSLSRDCAAVLLLAATWLAASALVDPAGEHPLDDDRPYAGRVRALVEHGIVEIEPWTPAAPPTHALPPSRQDRYS